MTRRFLLTAVVAAAMVLIGAAFAIGGGTGLIYDDGHFLRPGSLDDGKALLPQTKITVAQADAAARRAATGQLGQVDLERHGTRVVYVVDVGNREVSVDASDGSIVAIGPRS